MNTLLTTENLSFQHCKEGDISVSMIDSKAPKDLFGHARNARYASESLNKNAGSTTVSTTRALLASFLNRSSVVHAQIDGSRSVAATSSRTLDS